jgi:23S rRNA pseudouridine2605 synthase
MSYSLRKRRKIPQRLHLRLASHSTRTLRYNLGTVSRILTSRMRLNKFIAASTELSRRKADEVIAAGRVDVNGEVGGPGQSVSETDVVKLDGHILTPPTMSMTVMLNKPRGYVVSRNGQGSQTIYDLLPEQYRSLNPIGRLDKDSSGLLLLTNDGQLAQELTHPSRQKIKTYHLTLDNPLQPLHRQMINDHGLQLEDGLSKLQLEREVEGDGTRWVVHMREGRNRQIRRTFAALGYVVTELHRTSFGSFELGDLTSGTYRDM